METIRESQRILITFRAMRLIKFPCILLQFHHITHVSITYNRLTSLPDDICKLSALKTLKVYRNLLTSLPRTLGKCTNLTALYADNNCLKRIPLALKYCIHLEMVDFRWNPLPLPAGVWYMSSYNGNYPKTLFFNMLEQTFSYSEPRASTMALLTLSKRKTPVLHKDILRSVLAPALYDTREEDAWYEK
jgi:Leucine-rich repeat (LRR) protein